MNVLLVLKLVKLPGGDFFFVLCLRTHTIMLKYRFLNSTEHISGITINHKSSEIDMNTIYGDLTYSKQYSIISKYLYTLRMFLHMYCKVSFYKKKIGHLSG